MCESHAAERACAGSSRTSACHQLSAGNSEQRVPAIGFASSGRTAEADADTGGAAGEHQRAQRRAETDAHGWSYGTTSPPS